MAVLVSYALGLSFKASRKWETGRPMTTAASLQDDGLHARRFHLGDVGGEKDRARVSPTFNSLIELETF